IRRYHRYHKRYEVDWDASLEASFQDFTGEVQGKVINFSVTGALLHLDQLYIDGQHLIVVQHKPKLNLKMFSPEGVLESRIEIRWYDRSAEVNTFQVGVKLIDIIKKNQEVIDRLISGL
ncbi:MAG: PilZ domain-containing protein, partial [Deltaproteobacteria bacterium]|nr:PilZ domain-containing protein [Deltaproteobacteria bacterium]